ncbi:MAG: glycosyltransferase [Leptolyngbyaceae cyanobacterium bins.302]|nr:glycosyltransferase [Leptolyngbyaceae cyanobacterium bins.302]
MKVALVHDCLREYGDAERLLSTLHSIYPQAPVYTAFVDRPRLNQINFCTNWDIRPTFAQCLPGVAQFYQNYRVLLPYFWESLDLSEYDLVISVSGEYASHSVLTRSQTLHINYCYTPPRALWEPVPPFQPNRWQQWSNLRARQYDFYAAQRVDRFVVNSETVVRRIRKFYRRGAEVIHPPVQVRGEGTAGKDYYLYVGELNPLQQVDLAIRACQRLERPLWVVGTGRERDRLQQMAGKTVRFLGAVADDAMADIYAGAIALIYPTAYEDFAVSPVAAMGHGVPVIASEQSGMKDVILNFRTGLLFPESTVEGLCEVLLQFEKLRFSATACIERAEEFAASTFVSKFEWFVAKALDDYHSHAAIAVESV